MKKIILTIGLQGSGKTYWAENFVKENKNYYNSNRDDLRFELFNKYNITKKQEQIITQEQLKRIKDQLNNDYSIIISDTNLNPKTQNKWKEFAEQHNLQLEIKDFRNVDIEICIKNDLQRNRSVGKNVILEFHNKYIRPTLYKHNNTKIDKKQAVIFDIDGTIAKMNNRSPYEWDKVSTDSYIKETCTLIMHYLSLSYEIIFLSGRVDCCYEATYNWIKEYSMADYDFKLFMRKTDDSRKDSIIKKEIFLEHIDKEYNVMSVFDDRPQVIRMWRDLGLFVFDVNQSECEF